MKNIDLNLKVEKVFGNLVRPRVVLIVPVLGDKVVVGEKIDYYPPGIRRLIGGGVKESEDCADAAQRELNEETGIKLPVTDFKLAAKFNVVSIDAAGKHHKNTTYVYIVQIDDSFNLKASDDISGLATLDQRALARLVENYRNLPDVLWYRGSEGEFSWSDYAKVYYPLHKFVLDSTYARSDADNDK